METRDRVRDLIARDLTVREIAQLLGISTQAVYKHLKVLDITPPTQRESESERGAA